MLQLGVGGGSHRAHQGGQRHHAPSPSAFVSLESGPDRNLPQGLAPEEQVVLCKGGEGYAVI